MNRRLVAAALSLLSLFALHKKLRRRNGVHRIRQMRRKRGAFFTLWPELKRDPVEFKKFVRMSLPAFEKLLDLVRPSLVRNSAREPISPEQRLVVTLRYLATGNSFPSLAFSFFLGESTVRKVVHATCKALHDVLGPVYLRTPSTQAEWSQVAEEFYAKWQLPNCLGAVDGKHIMMRAPANSGSLYFNYKGRFSTVLMAVADANYRILYASVGSYGHESDGGIFDRSDLGRAIKGDANALNLPGLAALPGSRLMCTHYFVGDDAFPHHKNLMKPFRQTGLTKERRIYNYRLSRGRRMIESTFGLLASKWRILLRNIDVSPDNCDGLVQAICSLHNYLIAEGEIYTGTGGEFDDVDADLPQAANLRNAHANHAGNLADMARTNLLEYFNGEGAVEWQNDSAPAVLRTDSGGGTHSPKRPRGLRAPGQYRTDELIEEIRKNRILWSREARGFLSPTSRAGAYKRVASAMNRRFPDVRTWYAEEVERHWLLLIQYQYACVWEHGPRGKPHCFTCRFQHMSFVDEALRTCSDWRTFIPRC